MKNTYLVRVINSDNKAHLEKISVHEWRQILAANKKLSKKDAKGNPIKGVRFAVYANEESAKNGTNAIMTAESNDDGIVDFKGLAYGSFSRTAAQKATGGVDNGSTDYQLH